MSTMTSGCGCGHGGVVATGSAVPVGITGCASTGAVGMERTRYFARQLVGADDLTQDQLYFREKSRRHNRMLHGWGIVCGARVRKGDGPCEVVVESGYILGPYGDEIVIDTDVVIDVCSEDLDGNVASPCGPVDPWCSDVRVDRPAGQPLYLAVAYAECLSRPVRAVSDGCGCDESACEYSRVRDSFRIVVLDALPSTYPPDARPPDIQWAVSCPRRGDDDQEECRCPACASCPTEPWVILADLTVEGSSVTGIDCDAHRRYVARFGDYYYMCEPARKPGVAGPRQALDRLLRADALRTLERAGDLGLASAARWSADRLDVADVEENSALGRRMKELSIAEVASLGQDAFVKEMVDATSEPRKELVARQAAEIWTKAAEVIVTISPHT